MVMDIWKDTDNYVYLKDGGKYYKQSKAKEDSPTELMYEIKDNEIEYTLGSKIVILDGYKKIPTNIISQYGIGFKEKTINTIFQDLSGVKVINIKFKQKTSISGDTLFIGEKDIAALHTQVRVEQLSCNKSKKVIVNNFLSENFPVLSIRFQPTNSNKDYILRNLNDKLAQTLTSKDVEKVGAFYKNTIEKFKQPSIKEKLAIDFQNNAKIATLESVIGEYENLLKSNPREQKWKDFFKKYITLFDTRYATVSKLDNIGLGREKHPDLVLVDIYGCLDIYELKKSNCPLLKYDKSHKTWYWSEDVSKVISQASDYLLKIREKAPVLAQEIRNDMGRTIFANNPKAIVLLGNSSELNDCSDSNGDYNNKSDVKRIQFKNLRESLKDIEFILYDELLDQMKNLLKQISGK